MPLWRVAPVTIARRRESFSRFILSYIFQGLIFHSIFPGPCINAPRRSSLYLPNKRIARSVDEMLQRRSICIPWWNENEPVDPKLGKLLSHCPVYWHTRSNTDL